MTRVSRERPGLADAPPWIIFNRKVWGTREHPTSVVPYELHDRTPHRPVGPKGHLRRSRGRCGAAVQQNPHGARQGLPREPVRPTGFPGNSCAPDGLYGPKKSPWPGWPPPSIRLRPDTSTPLLLHHPYRTREISQSHFPRSLGYCQVDETLVSA